MTSIAACPLRQNRTSDSTVTHFNHGWCTQLGVHRLGVRVNPMACTCQPVNDVGERRGRVLARCPLRALFQHPPPEPGGTVSDHRALQRLSRV